MFPLKILKKFRKMKFSKRRFKKNFFKLNLLEVKFIVKYIFIVLERSEYFKLFNGVYISLYYVSGEV